MDFTSADDVENFQLEISNSAEKIDFMVNAHQTRYELKVSTWDGEFQSLVWPDEKKINITEPLGPNRIGELRVSASLPLTLVVRGPIQLDFSIYDSIDKEFLGVGGRMIEVDEEPYVRTTVTLGVHLLGSDNKEIKFFESVLGDVFHEVVLGEVDMSGSED